MGYTQVYTSQVGICQQCYTRGYMPAVLHPWVSLIPGYTPVGIPHPWLYTRVSISHQCYTRVGISHQCYTRGLFLCATPVGYSLVLHPWVNLPVIHPWVNLPVIHPWVGPPVFYPWVIPPVYPSWVELPVPHPWVNLPVPHPWVFLLFPHRGYSSCAQR